MALVGKEKRPPLGVARSSVAVGVVDAVRAVGMEWEAVAGRPAAAATEAAATAAATGSRQ